MKYIFDTTTKKAQAVADLQHLLTTPGWNIIADILQENIKTREDIILNKEQETDKDKDVINEARKERFLFLFFLNLPKNQINDLISTDPKKDELDPYDRAEDIKTNE